MIGYLYTIIKLILVILMIIFGYMGFGLWILKKIKIKLDGAQKYLIAMFLSISLVTSVIAIVGQFLSVSAYYFLIPIFITGFLQYPQIFKIYSGLVNFIKENLFGSILLITCTLLFTSTLIFSRINFAGDLVLQEVHDSFWHLALIKNLQVSIPPAHPSTDTIVLTNYHYFYDLFLGVLVKFSGISSLILYYQVSVIFLSIGLVLSAFILGEKLKNKFSGYLLVLSTTLFGSLSYLIPVFFHPDQPWAESSFWVSQTFVMIVNPQVIFTLIITYVVILLILELELISGKITNKTRQYFALHFLIIIFIATSIGFKSYAWVILSVVYAVVLLREIFKYKSFYPFLLGIIYLLFSLPFVWLITKFKGDSFFYMPLWYTNSMIESPDRVNYLEWKFLQDHYLFKKNWLRLILLETKKLIVFYIGNLGIRSLFFGLPLFLFFKKLKKNVNWNLFVYIFVGFLFSSIFPLLYLQKGIVWNSIQFWYYALVFANIMFVVFIAEILEKKPKFLKILIVLILLLIAIPTTIKTFFEKTNSPFLLENETINQLTNLSSSDKIMICPENSYIYHSTLVSVLSPAKVYLANPSQLELIGSDKKISDELNEIIKTNDDISLKKLIESENINIFLCKDDHLTNVFQKMLGDSENNLEVKPFGSWKVINL